jgi:hypothetical protein
VPLDRLNGEVLDGLPPSPHIAIDPRHLAALSNYTTSYRPKRKFYTAAQRREIAKRPVWEDAIANAEAAFLAKGALAPVRFDVESGIIVQAYPRLDMLFVICNRKIAGTDYYHVSDPYHMPRPVFETLMSAAGRKLPKEHLQ